MGSLFKESTYEVLLIAGSLSLGLAGCGLSPGQTTSTRVISLTNGTVLPTMTGINVMPLTVSADSTMIGPDGVTTGRCLSLSDANSAVQSNSPCVSVTVCPPGALTGSSAHCQIISGLLLDTGSVGLRVFKSVLNSDLVSNLTPLTHPATGDSVAECITYGDGSADWGPVAHATVFLAGEPGVSTPIQLIDSIYGGSDTCNTYAGGSGSNNVLDQSPVGATGLGYNGILGVGLSTSDSSYYVGCTQTGAFASSGCNSTDISTSLTTLVRNPVSLLPQDYNGEILILPSVGSAGASSAFGYLVFGIGTQTNNIPSSSVTPFFADRSLLQTTAILNGVTNNAFIDSGTSYYRIPSGSSTASLTNCDNYNSSYAGFYCPLGNLSSQVGIVFPFLGNITSVTNEISLTIGNPLMIFNQANRVYSDIALQTSLSGFSNRTVDLGLPFYLGRTIYHGIEGYSSPLGTGPFWAF